eukprot:TRINITY_DN11447_c0_g9_i1.p1 TRINITY_DN11447_c0_g9~~TRINITY_DN11447_c0_g9_i1.p1  ORF type:complete len:199 (-),score=51.80 TRINITY_DN11447_c0_g9_i1:122-718(-)
MQPVAMASTAKAAVRSVLLCLAVTSALAGKPSKVVSHIQCDVCKLALKEARSSSKNSSTTDEDELAELVENLCLPKKPQGKWITEIDIVKSGDTLKLERQDKPGECRIECRAIQSACSKALNGKDEDIVSMLKDLAGLAKLQNAVCEKSCKKKKMPNLDDWVNEEFKENKDAAINDLMESMKGMPGMENLNMIRPGEL